MPYYSDSLDRETQASILRPMLQGEGWKVILGIVGRLMAQHDKAFANPTVEINTRLDRIGRREGLKELVDTAYKIIGESSPLRYPELIPQAPTVMPVEEPEPVKASRQPGLRPRRRSGSVA